MPREDTTWRRRALEELGRIVPGLTVAEAVAALRALATPRAG